MWKRTEEVDLSATVLTENPAHSLIPCPGPPGDGKSGLSVLMCGSPPIHGDEAAFARAGFDFGCPQPWVAGCHPLI